MITGTVAELLAVMGLDSSNFDQGLMRARVNLASFKPPVISAQQAVSRLGQEMGEVAAQTLDFAAAASILTENQLALAGASNAATAAALKQGTVISSVRNFNTFGGGGTGLSGGRQAAVEIEALEGSRFGIARLLSMLPAVQVAMEAAFAPILAGVLLYGLYELGSELNKLITDWEGFGDAAQEAWSKAEVGEQQAILGMNDYQRKMEEAKGLLSIAGEKGPQYNADKYKLDAAADEHEKTRLKAQQSSIEKNELGPLEKRIDAYDRIMGPAGMRQDSPATQAQLDAANEEARTIVEDRKTALALHEKEEEIAKRLGQLDIDKVTKQAEYLHQLDSEQQKKTAIRKEHDPVHELPYRLPWFMGSNPATDFLGGSKMTPGPNPGALWRAPISIQNTHHITIQGGDSSSIKDAIPDLLDALENNSNGSMARLSDILRDSGIAPSV